jgi:hypothetical protein
MDFLASRNAHLLTGRPIFDASLLVDGDNAVDFRNRIGRTFANTGLVVDTTRLAYLHGHLGSILRTTRDINPGVLGEQVDDLLGTGLHASPASHTFLRINDRKGIDHGDSIEVAGTGAFPESHATILASHGAGKSQFSTRARAIAHIVIFFVDSSRDP